MTYDDYDDEDGFDYETNGQFMLTWNFDWSELKLAEVDRITGSIVVKPVAGKSNISLMQIEVDMNNPKQSLVKNFNHPYKNLGLVAFEYVFCLHYNPRVIYKEMFLPSDETDAVLVVDGKKIYVCKAASET